MGGFEQFLRLIQNGEPVNAGTANRPITDLDQNVRYLWNVLQAVNLGSTVFARQQIVEPAALPGMAVYYAPDNQCFMRGLAAIQSRPADGQLVTAASSQIWGVVYEKTTANVADMLLFGYAPLNLGQAVIGALGAGLYYLSGSVPGMLTQQRPPVSVPVLRADGSGNVFVVPQVVDMLDRHVHYKFTLICRPAGAASTPSPGEKHVITAPNAALPGWLPASDASFNGLAPANAVFGYNLNADPGLKNAWPPLPTGQGYLEWDKAIDRDVGYTGVPLGPDGLCVLDRNGIWWLSSCWDEVPWPDYFSLSDPEATSESLSESDQCPRPLNMGMTLWFTKLNFDTEATVVTSLQSADSRLSVTCIDGSPATTGALQILLNMAFTVNDGNVGYLALKGLDGSALLRGPVQEGTYALSNNVTLTSPAQRYLNPTDPTTPVVYQGPVGIAVNQYTTQELDVLLTRLDVAQEEYFEDVTYLALYAGQVALIRSQINVPSDTALPNPVMTLRFRIMGTAIGGLPPLALTARQIPRPNPESPTTPLLLPDDAAEFSVAFNVEGTLSQAYQYVEIASASFSVNPGDIVFFTLSRDGDSDTYPGDVGILQQIAVLSAGG